MRISDQDRVSARVERKKAKRKMSAKAAMKLREMANQKEQSANAEMKFAKQFSQVDKDGWTLRQVLERIARPANESSMTKEQLDSYNDRRALKLRRCLANGWKPQCVHDVVFLSELTPEEQNLTDDDFYDLITRNWPIKPKPQPMPRHNLRCAICEATFTAQRSDARYCSQACRLKGHRRGLIVFIAETVRDISAL